MKQYNLRHIISRIISFFTIFLYLLRPWLLPPVCVWYQPQLPSSCMLTWDHPLFLTHLFFFFLDLWLFLFICLGLCPVGSHIPWNEVPAHAVLAGVPVLIVLSYLWHFCTKAFSRLCIFITIWHDWLTISAWFTVYPDHLWRMVPMNLFPYLVIISGTNVL